ncbi:MAG: hypothetical protein ACI9DC_000054 [Gammaproteobacteria bacterium]
MLAQHCAQAELWESALQYWRKAGVSARSRRANREATRCFEQSLSVLAYLPQTQGNLEVGIDLRFDLRNSLYSFGELDRILEYLREVERLARGLNAEARLARVGVFLAQATGDFASQVLMNFSLN